MPTLNFCGWKSDSQNWQSEARKLIKRKSWHPLLSPNGHVTHIGGEWVSCEILDLSYKFSFRLVTFNLILDKIPKKPPFYSRRINLHFVNNKAIVFRIDIDKLPKILQNHYVVVETNCIIWNLHQGRKLEDWGGRMNDIQLQHPALFKCRISNFVLNEAK